MKGGGMKSGIELRNEGMQLSLFNADDKVFEWSVQARFHLERFLRLYPEKEFQAEDLRRWAYQRGLKEPPSHRAWGAIISRAKKEGLIRFVGYENVTNPRAHATPAAVWISA
jgi:hypothetical protein